MPLNIDIGGDASGFATAMAKAQALAELAMDNMKKRWADTGSKIKDEWQGKMTSMVKGVGLRAGALAAGVGGVIAAYAVVSRAITEASEALERYVDLQKKADAAGAPVEAYQRWMELSNKLRVSTEDLEGALKAASAALREGAFGESSKFLKQASEIFGGGNAVTGEFQSGGFRNFVLSETDEQRLRAGLDMVRELLELSRPKAAATLAETLLGKDFADKIMSGRVSVEQLTAEIDKIAANKQLEIITQDQINNAVDIKNRIAEAKEELDRALGVSKLLTEEGLAFKAGWASILEAILSATKALQGFFSGLATGTANALANARTAAGEIEAEISRKRLAGMQEGTTEFIREQKRLERLTGEVATRKLLPEGGGPGGADFTTTATGLPLRGPAVPERPPLDIEKNKAAKDKAAKDTSESLDQVERFIIQQQRANEILTAETAAYGQSNLVKEQGVALARANAAARLAERDLTAEETEKIKANAAARAALLDKMEKMKDMTQLQHFFGEQVVSSLEKMTEKGAKFSDVMTDVGKAIQRAAIQALILGEGPLAALFGTKGVGGASGGLIGILGKAFSNLNTFQEGGVVPGIGPQLAVVHGGETIIPPKIAGSVMAGGGVTVQINQPIDARGSQMGVAEQIAAALDANNRAIRVQLPAMIRDARSRSSL